MNRVLRPSRRAAALVFASTIAVGAGAAQVSATTAPDAVERQPLTGVPIDGTLVTYTPRPAMVVKIDNVDAEPQSGLNEADIVYEEIVEGRATRFAAVFNSMEANPVGPIRSGRTQDVNLLSNLNDPVFVWSGGNAGVTGVLQQTGWTLLGQGTAGFFRDSSQHGAPHNLFANMSELWPQAGDSGNAVPIFEYSDPGAAAVGTPVSTIDALVGSFDVHWEWNPEQGFLRSQRGSTHETTTGQVSTNNVVFILTGYGVSPHGGGPEAVTTGSGQVVVYTNGHKIEGTWTRETPQDPWTLEANGQPILLFPGRTWVELVDGAAYELTDA
jgi:hypothetical protein